MILARIQFQFQFALVFTDFKDGGEKELVQVFYTSCIN